MILAAILWPYQQDAIHSQDEERIQKGVQAVGEDELGTNVRESSNNLLTEPAYTDEEDKYYDVTTGAQQHYSDLLMGAQ